MVSGRDVRMRPGDGGEGPGRGGHVVDVPGPVASWLAGEMRARGLVARDVAEMIGGDPDVAELSLDLVLRPGVRPYPLTRETAAGLARAFDVDAEDLLSRDRAWRRRVLASALVQA